MVSGMSRGVFVHMSTHMPTHLSRRTSTHMPRHIHTQVAGIKCLISKFKDKNSVMDASGITLGELIGNAAECHFLQKIGAADGGR